MTKAQHTPGPWLISSSGHNCFTVHADEASSIVAYTLPRFKVAKGQAEPAKPSEEDWANSNLIAAAPELLKACEDAEQFVRGFEDDSTQPSVKWLCGQLRNAIAKARETQTAA